MLRIRNCVSAITVVVIRVARVISSMLVLVLV